MTGKFFIVSNTTFDDNSLNEINMNSSFPVIYNENIKYIFHISDIHVRNTTRHDEYKYVFDKLYESIAKNDKTVGKSCIVITGDIFHSKCEHSPEAIDLTYNFLLSLSKLHPVILIAGNHDMNLLNKTRMDAITPTLINRSKDIHFLNTRGHYIFNNILFSLTHVSDNTVLPSCKLDSNMYVQQILENSKIKYHIALYHGSVYGNKSDVAVRVRKSFYADMFDGYDYVLLGDIHRRQMVSDNIGYSGSLIQQNYSESIDHGYLLWDLENSTVSEIDIPNKHIFLRHKIEKNISYNNIDKHLTENVTNISLQLDLVNIENELIVTTNICNYLNNKNILIDDIVTNIINDNNNINVLSETSIDDVRSDIIIDNIVSSLKNQAYDDNMINSILDIHNNYNNKILATTISNNNIGSTNIDNCNISDGKKKWNIIKLNFSNMMSYGDNNSIDFTKYDKNSLIGIIAPNHTGKSNLIEVLLFMLFDRISKDDRCNILNRNSKSFYGELIINQNGNLYSIQRGGSIGNDRNKISTYVNFYSIDKNGNILNNMKGIGAKETNENIVNMVGTYDDFISSYFTLQRDGKTFVTFTPLQKKKYLNMILGLDKIHTYFDINKIEMKDYIASIKLLEKELVNSDRDITSYHNSIKEDEKIIELNSNNLKLEDEYFTQLSNVVEDYLSIKINDESIINCRPEIKNMNIDKINILLENLNDNNCSNDIIDRRVNNYDLQSLLRLKNKLEIEISTSPIHDVDIDTYDMNISKLSNVKTTINNKTIELNKLRSQQLMYESITKDSNNVVNMIKVESEKLIEAKKIFSTMSNTYESKCNSKDVELETQLRKEFICQLQNISRRLKNMINTKSVIDDLINVHQEWIDIDVKTNYNDMKKLIEKLTENKNNLMEKYCTIKQNQIKLDEIGVQYLELESVIGKLNDERSELTELVSKCKQAKLLEEKRKSLEDINNQIDLLRTSKSYRTELIEWKQYLEAKNSKLELIKKERERTSRISESSKKRESYIVKINEAKSRIEINKEKINNINKKYEQLTNINIKLSQCKIYDKLMDYSGISYQIISNYLPILEKTCNDILHKITNFDIIFSNDTNIDISVKYRNIDGSKVTTNIMPVNLVSGFEMFVITLSIRIAMSKLSRTSSPNLFVIDEGFSCLDNVNQTKIDSILKFISSLFDYTLLITHIDQLKDYITDKIIISKDNGFSRIINN